MIEVKNLTKRYGQHVALDNINFTVDSGEVLGFLGPNGAGKTTTMNIMTGYIAATEGEVRIHGADIVAEPEKAKAHLGYLPDTPPVYGDMRVDEYLAFVADVKRVKRPQRRQMLEDIKATVGISEMSKRLIKNLSKGYRQRVGLAQAMVGYPKVIIMDEPTVGLDPQQIIEMRDVIRRLGKKHTVILSSHILQEVSAVCDRIMIINRGRIVASDTTERLSSSFTQSGKLLVRVKGEEKQILAALGGYPAIQAKKAKGREPGCIDLECSGEGDVREAVFSCMAAAGHPILLMKPFDLSLEEIFLKIITGAGEEDAS